MMTKDRSLTEATGTTAEVAQFLDQVAKTPAPLDTGGRGRLLFAMDATASRQPSWDTACQVQGQMFIEADRIGGLDVQLAYYRGFAECKTSPWVSRPADLVRLMSSVQCMAGHTQVARILKHAIKETGRKPVSALVFVGDCFEEDVDRVGHLAGELGMLGVRAFLFHEGKDGKAERAFRQIAKLTSGAYCPLDANSPQQLRELLGAVAAYSAGGRKALTALAGRNRAVGLIESQLQRP
ncbi:VWA domain-containing protein [Marinivivus vitaminiproducens]|uniref:VWA domain-containing protein n=1 Tax=Marinivivus vitaminiproducens TaxID=3035935 RepID=UPI00279E10C2|nr:VWA domain-containing protein [Geminicoccaceae bacterium SCSIO 64248]